MAFTRAQIRTRVMRRLDATGSTHWDTTIGATGEVDQVMGFVFDREWRGILNANPYYRVSLMQPTSDSSGRYAISALSGGSGDTATRFYRVLAVVIDNAVYQEGDFKDYILADRANSGFRIWYRMGDYIVALPLQASKTLTGTDGIYVSTIPTRIDSYSNDNVNVVFPDGYEEILCLEAAAHLLAKGGAETNTTAEFKALASALRNDMLDDIARVSINPKRMRYPDTAWDWGA